MSWMEVIRGVGMLGGSGYGFGDGCLVLREVVGLG